MKVVMIIAIIGTVLPAEAAEAVMILVGRLASMSLVSTSGGGQPIQTGAESFCFSWATLILRSSNSQKPLPLKKYVLPAEKAKS